MKVRIENLAARKGFLYPGSQEISQCSYCDSNTDTIIIREERRQADDHDPKASPCDC